MYRIELMKDSPKGANSVLIGSKESVNPSLLFEFACDNEMELFPCKPELMEYFTEAIEEIAEDYNGENKTINEIIKLNNEYNETDSDTVYCQRNDLIYSLMQDKEICIKVLDLIHFYNIGINFKKISK